MWVGVCYFDGQIDGSEMGEMWGIFDRKYHLDDLEIK
jgi:hypothetical protein